MLTLPHLPPLVPSESGLRLDTLIGLRWLAVGGQTLSVLVVYFVFGFSLPILSCLAVIATLVIVNLVSRLRFPAATRLSERAAFFYLGFDMAELSVLVYLTGGLENPFAILFLVPVIVSASSLRPGHTALLGACSLVIAAALTYWHLPLPWYRDIAYAPPVLITLGQWFALAASTTFMSLYVFRISRESRQLSDALAATELALMQEQHLSQLDGLAAAAAHELGTPLGTIALVAKELERDEALQAAHGEDITLLRSQVARCRDIMSKLTSLGTNLDEPFHRLPLSHLIEEVAEPHRHFGITVCVHAQGEGAEPIGRRNPAILYGLGNLIENAVDFAQTNVDIKARWNDRRLSILVRDDGPGFRADILAKLGEPYVTSRPGREEEGGLGLGFFIAKRLIERTGGRLSLANLPAPDHGAQVRIEWERAAFEAES